MTPELKSLVHEAQKIADKIERFPASEKERIEALNDIAGHAESIAESLDNGGSP